jgi:hypothetical protein
MPFGFHLAMDTLPSGESLLRPTTHYCRLWIWRSSFERQRDFNPPEQRAAQRTLCPRLTPAARSEWIAPPSVTIPTCSGSPEVSSTAFRAQPPDLPPVRLVNMNFAVICPLALHRRPHHPVLVHGLALLIHASFRPCLTTTPLRFSSPSPPPGWTGDFHPQAVEHVRHTKQRSNGISPLLLIVLLLFRENFSCRNDASWPSASELGKLRNRRPE